MEQTTNTAAQHFRMGLTQWHAGRDLDANLKQALQAIHQCAEQGAQLISLPENGLFLGSNAEMRAAALSLDSAPIEALRNAARQVGVPVTLGGFKNRDSEGRIHNSAIVMDKRGELAGHYHKIHLFDANVAGQSFEASSVELRGQEPVILNINGVKIGMTICYDVRFPELFRALALQDAQVFLVPAAFTYTTGQAHWEVLLRARAIENAAFVVASATVRGEDPTKDAFQTWGHAMVVDPWGKVLTDLDSASAAVQVVDLDLSRVAEIRTKLPVLKGVQPSSYTRSPRVIELS
ncbi:carbon-nitrogen hydrolase family protein [Comamonas sp. Z1]|uniref:carbon-nitrogen hydrolase family protein n=1 Tax=Comamonas TaxID=283 RepID=UPI0006B98CD9|nr:MULTISPECIES: carbon-nitrogen hydrolase family protein [Comamonas]TYK71015.1 carbon-nitrogen hydrolase family protein [Comamonas sp. Z1]TYK73389.1 carbon-nitrogen hydrolase family protein [Comamonas sp. Z3]